MNRIVQQVKFQTAPAPVFKKVAAYARVSTGKDAMLHSLSAQVSYYSSLIQNHKGWQYAGVYIDEAVSGTKSSREGFQKLINDCKAGKIDMVITKSISRFGRNTVTLLQTVRELKDIGVDVFFEEQNLHSTSADGELMLTILASYAQEESFSASENQKWRIRKGFENGELVTLRFLYGYSIKRGSIEVNPKEAEIVREIFGRYIGGDSLSSIVTDLNKRGIPGALGGEWCIKSVRRIVTNEKYTGNALLQKTYISNHLDKTKVKNNGELPMYFAKGTHEGIIDEETFLLAQKRVEQMESEAKPKPDKTLFSGIIRCSKCGKNYRRVTADGRHFFNCTTYINKGKAVCHTSKIPEDEIYNLTCEVLGTGCIDRDALIDKITVITADDNNILTFHLTDGTTAVKRWQHKSRADSWTKEKRNIASIRTTEQRRCS